MSAKFDMKLDEEMSKLRLEMAAMKFDPAILSLMLRGGGSKSPPQAFALSINHYQTGARRPCHSVACS